MKALKVLPLVAVLLLGGVACGDDTEDATSTESPALTDNAGDEGGTGGAGDTTDASPGPVGSPDATPGGTASGPDTGGGAIYDETPSVEPAE